MLIFKGFNLISDTASRMRTSRSQKFSEKLQKRSEDEFFYENPPGKQVPSCGRSAFWKKERCRIVALYLK